MLVGMFDGGADLHKDVLEALRFDMIFALQYIDEIFAHQVIHDKIRLAAAARAVSVQVNNARMIEAAQKLGFALKSFYHHLIGETVGAQCLDCHNLTCTYFFCFVYDTHAPAADHAKDYVAIAKGGGHEQIKKIRWNFYAIERKPAQICKRYRVWCK